MNMVILVISLRGSGRRGEREGGEKGRRKRHQAQFGSRGKFRPLSRYTFLQRPARVNGEEIFTDSFSYLLTVLEIRP